MLTQIRQIFCYFSQNVEKARMAVCTLAVGNDRIFDFVERKHLTKSVILCKICIAKIVGGNLFQAVGLRER